MRQSDGKFPRSLLLIFALFVVGAVIHDANSHDLEAHERLDAIGARLEVLEQPGGTDVDLTPIHERLTALEIIEPGAVDLEPIDRRLSLIESEVARITFFNE